jgi:tRNA (cytidine/uridine-2'-O-)-methyltransferase
MPQVVLFEPQIPPNTGNVARTCAACGCALHLIEPLGFRIDDRHLRRAGLDYWPLVDLHPHRSWPDFQQLRGTRPGRLLAFSSHGRLPYHQFRFEPDDWLLFGRECDGLPAQQLRDADAVLTIPMARHASQGGRPGVRSLNLSVAVGIALFEVLRQLGRLDRFDPPPPEGSAESPSN